MLRVLICALTLVALIEGGDSRLRRKRYLVYPDGGPARAQFIVGLGIPVDLKEQSVTVGTVFKFQYDLPTNSTEYTSRIYGFANTVSRGMDDEVPNEINGDTNTEQPSDNNTDIEDVSENKDTLIDINFDDDKIRDDRKKRALVYAEGGSISTNDMAEIQQLSLDEAITRQEAIEKKLKDEEEEEEVEPQRVNRWDFYKIMENMVERYGYTGRPCLLRTICEAAEVPFTHESGLLGELGHILFTPSTTTDALSHHADNEYHAAERLGRQEDVDCERLFPECESSVLETFTQIGIDTLHKFGF